MFSRVLSVAAALALALGANAQTSQAYSDATTGIDFQTYYDTTGYSFGLALPESNGTDLIGMLVGPSTNQSGWAGVSLNGNMAGPILVVAWPNGEDVVGSLRMATGYTAPDVYTGDASLEPIAKGTFVNSTHYSYTFLCKGCVGDDSFTNDGSVAVLGWALSDESPDDPSDDAATLPYHSAGFGEYGMKTADAKSSDYSTWAAMASASTSSSGNSTSSAGNSTATSSATTTSAAASAPTATSTAEASYDYIIVGAGAAGIIVAERLAETKKSVLLIERGGPSLHSTGNNNSLSWNSSLTQYDVPALAYDLLTADDTSEYCTDTASTAGCLLGGSTMVNALMYVRPQEVDFNDKWPTGWKWSDVSAAAQRLYTRNPGTTTPSLDGKLYDQSAYNILSTFFKGAGWSEVDALKQPNSKYQVYSHPPWNIKDAKRAGPVMTYLPLAEAMGNFKLQMNTKVVRAVRNGSYVSGVEVETGSGGTRQIINVKEGGKVILAAGTLSTPRILFNSGIGPADQISTVANGTTAVTLPAQADWIESPVGKNLKDHPIFTLKFTTNQTLEETLGSAVMSPNSSLTTEYAKGTGVLAQGGQRLNFWTSVNGTDGVRYIQGTTSMSSEGVIQMKIYLTHGLTSSGVLGITASGTTELVTKPWLTTQADKDAIASFLDTLIAYTKRSGSNIALQSSVSNPTGADLISNYVTGDHFVGSAMMGTDEQLKAGEAVVDTDTKVYGTDNLFVVDGSIHPDLPTGNTQAIIMVVAEAAAEKVIAAEVSSSGSGSAVASGTSSVSAKATGVSSAVTSAAAQTSAAQGASPLTTTVTNKRKVTATVTASCSTALAAKATSAPSESAGIEAVSSEAPQSSPTVFVTNTSVQMVQSTVVVTHSKLAERATVTVTAPAGASCTV